MKVWPECRQQKSALISWHVKEAIELKIASKLSAGVIHVLHRSKSGCEESSKPQFVLYYKCFDRMNSERRGSIGSHPISSAMHCNSVSVCYKKTSQSTSGRVWRVQTIGLVKVISQPTFSYRDVSYCPCHLDLSTLPFCDLLPSSK